MPSNTCFLMFQKSVRTRQCEDRDHLTQLYLRHVIPLPQRTLPNNRWGKRINKNRESQTPAGNRLDRYLTTRKMSTIGEHLKKTFNLSDETVPGNVRTILIIIICSNS